MQDTFVELLVAVILFVVVAIWISGVAPFGRSIDALLP